jgi:hypothetical protein
MKRLLTLNDLYNYYSSTKKSTHFSAIEDNENIVVQINGKLNFKKSEKDTEGLREVYLQACHIDENVNGSNIKKSVMTAALPSFSNRPILGYIHDVDGKPEFYGHNMHVDDEGNVVYDEVPIGVIPESCDAKLVYDKDKDKTYVEVKGYIFEEYSKASEILEREQECSVSVELSIRELSYDAKNKYLDIEDFFFSGVTILGKNDEGEIVRPGMSGSNIKLADFSMENNSMFSQNDKLIETLERLNKTLSEFNIDKNRKEEQFVESNKNIEEVVEEVIETTDEAVVETTDEVVEETFEDATEESTEEVVTEETSEETTEESTEETPDVVVEEETTETEETVEEVYESNINYSVNGKNFAVSLDDIQYALNTLVNDTYAEQDGCYYATTIYEDHLVMIDYWTGKAYRQSYKKRKDVYSLTGDRVAVKSCWLTADEEKAIDDMRSNFAEVSEKLAKYEAEPAKMEVINSDAYAKISETKEFAELRDNHFDLSVEEVSAKADEILLAYAKGGSLNFSAESEKKSVGMTRLPIQTNANKKSRYGSLFSK